MLYRDGGACRFYYSIAPIFQRRLQIHLRLQIHFQSHRLQIQLPLEIHLQMWLDLEQPLKIRAYVEVDKNVSHLYKCTCRGSSFRKPFFRGISTNKFCSCVNDLSPMTTYPELGYIRDSLWAQFCCTVLWPVLFLLYLLLLLVTQAQC